jgi:hypothetical protein
VKLKEEKRQRKTKPNNMTQTPEEKGKELVATYYQIISLMSKDFILRNWEHVTKDTSDNYFIDAKQCAIICVDEMISVSLPASDYGESTDKQYTTEYLQEVRKAIEKL